MTEFDSPNSIAGGRLTRFWADESGATAIEYALIAAGVGVTVAGAVWSLGSDLKSTFYDKLAAVLP